MLGGIDQSAGPGLPKLQGWVLSCLDVEMLRRLLGKGFRIEALLHCIAEEVSSVHASVGAWQGLDKLLSWELRPPRNGAISRYKKCPALHT